MTECDPKTVGELTLYVQNNLQQMQDKFQRVEETITERLSKTGKKIDEIERQLTELMDHSGIGEPFDEDKESDKL